MQGKVALVTGATKGIGRACAEALAAAGATILVVARSETDVQEFVAKLQSQGATVHGIIADLSTYEGLDKVVLEAVRLTDGFDILVNNAGRGHARPMVDVSDTEFDLEVALNLRAPFMLTQSAIKIMRRRGGGQVVQIASGLAYFARGGWSLYCATKFGLRGFTEAVRQEVGKEGIKIGIVAPGYTKTHFFDKWEDTLAGTRSFDGALAPEDVAHAVMAMVTQGPNSDMREITVRTGSAP